MVDFRISADEARALVPDGKAIEEQKLRSSIFIAIKDAASEGKEYITLDDETIGRLVAFNLVSNITKSLEAEGFKVCVDRRLTYVMEVSIYWRVN